MLRRTLTAGVAALALGLGLAACGDDDDQGSGYAAPTATNAAPDTGGAPAGGGATVRLAADPGGQLAYDKQELSAQAGKVTIDFTNESSIPHDVVLERDGDDVAESDEITGSETQLAADLTAGEYGFYCSVAGHRGAGMEGKLTVK